MESLLIIPDDRKFIPPEEKQEEIVGIVQDILPDAGDIDLNFYTRVQFFSPGDLLKAVICPACSGRLDVGPDGENSGWWLQSFDSAQQTDCETYNVKMPCCSNDLPFTNLGFEPAAGFASFEIAISDPQSERDLNEEEMSRLNEAVGCKCIQIRTSW